MLLCPWLRACLLCETSMPCRHCAEAEERPKKRGVAVGPTVSLTTERMKGSGPAQGQAWCREPTQNTASPKPFISIPGEAVGRVQQLIEAPSVLLSSLTRGWPIAQGPLRPLLHATFWTGLSLRLAPLLPVPLEGHISSPD